MRSTDSTTLLTKPRKLLAGFVLLILSFLSPSGGWLAFLLFYSGAVIVLRAMRRKIERVRVFGFALPENATSLLIYTAPLFVMTIVSIGIPGAFGGTGPLLLWTIGLLSILLVLVVPTMVALKQLEIAFEAGTAPDNKIPYVVVEVPSTAGPSARMFFSVLQWMNVRGGRKVRALTRQARKSIALEKAGVTNFGLAIPPASLKLSKQELERLEELLVSGDDKKLQEFMHEKQLTSSDLPDERYTKMMRIERRAHQRLLELREQGRSTFVQFRYLLRVVLKEVLPSFSSLVLETKLNRAGFVMVTLNQVRARGGDFLEYVARHAAASLIFVPGPRLGERLDELYMVFTETNAEVQDRLAEEILASRKRFSQSEHQWTSCVPGQPFVIFPTILDNFEDCEGYFALAQDSSTRWKEAGRNVFSTLHRYALPGATSCIESNARVRGIPGQLVCNGLAPVADAYNRYRTSGSTVERFLNSFDCFETLIKYSVLMLHFSRDPNEEERRDVIAQLVRPSLGVWVGMLRDLVQSRKKESTEAVDEPVIQFWHGNVGSGPHAFFEVAKGLGLAQAAPVPRSHLQFLDWLVSLRNKTKGHGGATEATSLPLWHEFHVAFLEFCDMLGELALESQIVVRKGGIERVMLGCIRGGVRQRAEEEEGGRVPVNEDGVFLVCRGSAWKLDPFVRFEGDRCLTWNSGRDGKAEYVDYATGGIERLRYSQDSVITIS